MRTITEVRARLLEKLSYMARRPGMFGPRHSLEMAFLDVLSDLMWIDERESELGTFGISALLGGAFSHDGVYGSLCRIIPSRQIEEEMASIYSALAYQLGYLTIDRTLSEKEWQTLKHWTRQAPVKRDWRRSQILAKFGEPSLAPAQGGKRVHCYAGPNAADDWICLDYFYDRPIGGDSADPILRDVRRTGTKLCEAIVFTPFGRKQAKAAKANAN